MLATASDLKTYMDITLSNRQLDAAEMILEGLQSEMEAYLGRPVTVDQFVEDHVIPAYDFGVPYDGYMYDKSLDSTSDPLRSFVQAPIMVPLLNTPVVSVNSVTVKNSYTTLLRLSETMQREAPITNAVASQSNVVYTAANDFVIGQSVYVSGVSPSVFNVQNKSIIAVTDTTFTVKHQLGGQVYSSGGNAVATGTDYKVAPWGIELYSAHPNDLVTVEYTGGLDGENIKVLKLMILRAATREMQNMHDDTVGVKDLTTRGVAVLENGFLEKELLVLNRFKRRRIAR